MPFQRTEVATGKKAIHVTLFASSNGIRSRPLQMGLDRYFTGSHPKKRLQWCPTSSSRLSQLLPPPRLPPVLLPHLLSHCSASPDLTRARSAGFGPHLGSYRRRQPAPSGLPPPEPPQQHPHTSNHRQVGARSDFAAPRPASARLQPPRDASVSRSRASSFTTSSGSIGADENTAELHGKEQKVGRVV
jgi:hypothetical protein